MKSYIYHIEFYFTDEQYIRVWRHNTDGTIFQHVYHNINIEKYGDICQSLGMHESVTYFSRNCISTDYYVD